MPHFPETKRQIRCREQRERLERQGLKTWNIHTSDPVKLKRFIYEVCNMVRPKDTERFYDYIQQRMDQRDKGDIRVGIRGSKFAIEEPVVKQCG